MILIDRLRETIDGNPFPYTALPHGVESQPPASIRNYSAISRDVRLNGCRTPFYFGDSNHQTRINFYFAGIWYRITEGEQPIVDGQQANLYPLLIDLSNEFDFVIVER